MVKIMVADILYIEADRNYCRIFTSTREYLLSITLKIIEDKLPSQLFLRIHRSYMINLAQVDEVAGSHVMIAQKAIPLSAGLKEQLMERIKTV
jgi:DNA-binding LytR/AlgR family response regulator